MQQRIIDVWRGLLTGGEVDQDETRAARMNAQANREEI